jgi:hypothetical protein
MVKDLPARPPRTCISGGIRPWQLWFSQAEVHLPDDLSGLIKITYLNCYMVYWLNFFGKHIFHNVK